MINQALYVCVIAHPDDESMFFVPTIKALQSADETVWIVCLTTGDYDGLGKTRCQEMLQASKLLKVGKLLVRENLKDHPTQRWDVEKVQKEIQDVLAMSITSARQRWDRICFITFDQNGVSGHMNHIDTYVGVRNIARQGSLKLISEAKQKSFEVPVEAWTLISETNIVAKYIPIWSWILLILSFVFSIATLCHTVETHRRTYRLFEPRLNWKAMATHRSQFVWYRRLFVVFSCYTYVNILEKVAVDEAKEK